MRLADFDYHLPPEYIAQTPVEPRDASRLMVLRRQAVGGEIMNHTHFRNLGDYLHAGDVLVFNDTRVLPARLWARKAATGGRVELLLLKRRAPMTWEALVGGQRVHAGVRLEIEGGDGIQAVIVDELEGGSRVVQFSQPLAPLLSRIGEMPLPPYIHTPLADPERYQTVYARTLGSAAAPTAGLHFTPQLLDDLVARGITLAWVTLHVGLDTFKPVTVAEVEAHAMHGEWCAISAETAAVVNAAKREGRRVIAVGTTCVRALESAAQPASTEDVITPWEDITHLYILPGYRFRVVDALITNFHLPRSTLLMLVAAFAGRETILAAYAEAIRQGYRFYSWGDAMLIV